MGQELIALAERLFYEAKYPEDQYALLVRAMDLVAQQRPLALRAATVGTIKGVTVSPKDEHVLFFRIDLPKGTEIGESSYFDVLQQDSKTRRPQGGSRYRVVVNQPG